MAADECSINYKSLLNISSHLDRTQLNILVVSINVITLLSTCTRLDSMLSSHYAKP